MDDSRGLERTLPPGASNGEWVHEILNGGPAQTIPPSLKQGLDLGALKVIFYFIFNYSFMRKITACFMFDLIPSLKFDTPLVSYVLSYLQPYSCSWNVYEDTNTLKSSLDEKLVS